MKNLTLIILLFFLFPVVCFAQSKYSLENLEKSTQKELATYLNEAQKLKKTGGIVTIVGGSILVATIPITAMVAENNLDAADVTFFLCAGVGIGTLALGIPMYFTGRKRVKRIHSIRSSALNHVKIDLRPGVQYNFVAQKYQPGVMLGIRF